MRIVLVLAAALAALVSVGAADAVPKGPRCAIKDPVPPPRFVGVNGDAYLMGEFLNRCVDPVAEMGTYACLEEFDDLEDQIPRVVECHANIDKPVLVVPHETNVFMVALCDYTTIPRWYRISGYAWAISLKAESFQSRQEHSTKWLKVARSDDTRRFCHITKKGATWREGS